MDYQSAVQQLHNILGIFDLDYLEVSENIDPIIRSKHHISEASLAALSVLGSSISMIWHERTGRHAKAKINIKGAINQLMAWESTKCHDLTVRTHYSEDRKLLGNNGFYPTADGRPIFLITTYPLLRDIVCDILDSPANSKRMAEKSALWDSFELEKQIFLMGGCAAATRTRDEWLTHPVGEILNAESVVTIEKIAESTPISLPKGDNEITLPLTGIKFLDNTHVIAGSVATRFAAEIGAKVLHISTPKHQDSNAMILDTGIGKRSTFVDLATKLGENSFWKLLSDADVFVNSYLFLDKYGISSEMIAERCPGAIILDFHAWGIHGSWSKFGGFDQLACAATGFAASEGSISEPKLPATWLLNDYLCSIIGLAGTIRALQMRAEHGGSYRVHLDLARVCMWVQDFGLYPDDYISLLPDPSPARTGLQSINSVFGPISYLPLQILFDDFTFSPTCGPEPLGASLPAWW